jgi:hypothetical protein
MFQRIISGGQTGVDRAALDVAIALGLPHGGWCPPQRQAEDGRLADCYLLEETPPAIPGQTEAEVNAVRTAWNVRDSQGTLVLTCDPPAGGTALTIEWANRLGKPCLLVNLPANPTAATVQAWAQAHQIAILNVAGPREGESPGIYAQAAAFLREVFRPIPAPDRGPPR